MDVWCEGICSYSQELTHCYYSSETALRIVKVLLVREGPLTVLHTVLIIPHTAAEDQEYGYSQFMSK